MIHLDTSFLVDAIRESRRGASGPARSWLARHREEPLAISLFVLGELLVGAELHADSAAERRRVPDTCGGLPVVVADLRLPETYARLHAALQRQGEPLPTMDLLIASTAVNDGAALLTANERHFSRVPGLTVLSYQA